MVVKLKKSIYTREVSIGSTYRLVKVYLILPLESGVIYKQNKYLFFGHKYKQLSTNLTPLNAILLQFGPI